ASHHAGRPVDSSGPDRVAAAGPAARSRTGRRRLTPAAPPGLLRKTTPPGPFAVGYQGRAVAQAFLSAPTAAEAELENGRFRRARLRSPSGARARRKPRLWFRFVGVFLLRYAARQFSASLYQLPPRITRSEALDRSPRDSVAP